MYHRKIYVGAFVLLILVSNSFSQIKLDVKTSLQEKAQSKIVKAALIAGLQQSNWGMVTEYGENYSVWLSHLTRTPRGDLLESSILVEINTPSFINRGKPIYNNIISVDYDTTGIWVAAQQDSVVNEMISQGIAAMGIEEELITYFVGTALASPYVVLIKPFLKIVIDEIKRPPTTLEKFEATLLSAKILIYLNEKLTPGVIPAASNAY